MSSYGNFSVESPGTVGAFPRRRPAAPTVRSLHPIAPWPRHPPARGEFCCRATSRISRRCSSRRRAGNPSLAFPRRTLPSPPTPCSRRRRPAPAPFPLDPSPGKRSSPATRPRPASTPAPVPWIHASGRVGGLPPMLAHLLSSPEVPSGLLNSSPLPHSTLNPASAMVEATWESAPSDGAGKRGRWSRSRPICSTLSCILAPLASSAGLVAEGSTVGISAVGRRPRVAACMRRQRRAAEVGGDREERAAGLYPIGQRRDPGVSPARVFAGILSLGEESPRLPAARPRQQSRRGSLDGVRGFECGSGEFSPLERRELRVAAELAILAGYDL